MVDTYDPYRNAVRRALEDKAHKERKESFMQHGEGKKKKTKSFFQKKISLTDFIDLPTGLVNIVFLIFFILLPYYIGVIFTFVVLAKVNITTYENFHNPFAFSWVIGYELLATFFLLIILKSAIAFK